MDGWTPTTAAAHIPNYTPSALFRWRNFTTHRHPWPTPVQQLVSLHQYGQRQHYMQIGHYVLLQSIHIIIIENHEWIVCHPSLLLLHQPLHNQLKFYHSKDGHHNEEAIKTEPTTDKSQNRVHFISTHPKDRTTVLIVNCLLKRRRGSC